MLALFRQTHKHLRIWLLAAATVLLLTSVIEAGHAHGTLVEVDDHCVLCQHSVALDQALEPATQHSIPYLISGIAIALCISVVLTTTYRITLIRAPPANLHIR